MIAQEQQKDRRLQEIVDLAKTHGRTVQFVPKVKLDKISDGETPHQGVVAMVSPKRLMDIYDLINLIQTLPPEKPPLVLALDEVTDPRNFGALIRGVAGVGATAIMIPKVGSAGFSPAVGKASAGTIDLVNVVVVPNLVDAMERLKKAGLWWVGAALAPEAIVYDQYDFRGSTGIVLGNEGEGLRRLVREHCDQLVKIPLAESVESLNVSMAGGILLFEALRQRRLNR
jgi:23S rRNA (guanosine2251-2'-O)-methyltransferase